MEYFPPETEDEDEAEQKPPLPLQEQRNALAGIFNDTSDPLSISDLSLNDSQFVGFNGRTNKRVDTCYAFWVTASLAVCISKLHLHASYSKRG
jgi:geranylgeranyl transferase type-1 subunit beta